MLRFWIALAVVGCGSRTGLEIEPLVVDASIPDGLDASVAPFPCRWGLGPPLTLGESGGDLSVTVDETKLAVVGSGGTAWATREGRVFGPYMSLAPLSSRTPSGFVFVDPTCNGLRIDFGSEGDVEITPVPLVTGDRCWIGRGDRDAFPLFVARFGRVLVQRVPRNLEGFATIGEAPPSFAREPQSAALVDEQVYYREAGSLRWQDVGGRVLPVEHSGTARELAVDAVNRGVVVLLEDRAAFVARGMVDREVELAPVFPHLAVSDQEALALGLDGTLWTLPLSRGPARAVDRMPPPEDAIVALAEGHAVGGVASIEGPLVIWRPLTCNR